ncbi:hypothetical protein BH747_06335 [Enterococcus villorum]|uniref:Gram-positive cocci surface proteins LPxTG domain-containing protein n=1 Tax=Enterococcus villorum TaxID=112904 RepID=A0A1V8YDH0_9ENTE|nr:VaFE repeat-containing surface-anchored protein [Enterococcus villorum]OQO70629.1 hypothetical protein BH747_06335 [Enterococcus villorum]OQO72159.1 hypothetical protein BH744_12155 [Enterococcus villorum]
MVKVCKFLKWFVALLIIVLGSFVSVGNVVNAEVGEQIQIQKIKSLDKSDVNLKNWDDYSEEYKMSLVKNTATGHAVFCIQPEKEYPSSGSYLTVKSRLENKTIANLILNFQNQKEYLSHLNEDAQYAATQCAIFYVVSGNKDDLNVDPVVKKLINYANGLPDPIEKMNHFSLNITPNNQTMIKKGDGYSTTYSIETQASDLSDVQIDIKSNNKEAQEKVNYRVKGKELEINVPNEVVNHSQTQIHLDIKLTAKLVSTLQLSGYLVPAQSSRQDMATMQAFQVKSSKLYATDTQAIIETPTKPAEPTALETPEIKTNATNAKENTKMIPAIEKAQVKDIVDYKNLLPGKEYELHGKLMDKATGKALLIDGKEVTASKTFTPLEGTGQEALVFDFNASALTGKKLVVFEELTQAGQLVATHSDLNDANQTVEVPTKPAEPTALKTPEIKTNATNAKENTKTIPAREKAQVKDVVDYKNLLPGKEYELHGKLMDKATGKALLIDGKEVTASKTFTSLEGTGQEALVFDFNASALTGKKLVVFEELTQAGQLVATHSDLNDANQTVEVPTKPAEPTALKTPEIKTNATNAKENTKTIPAREKAQVKDVVDYKNLLPGKEYELHGKLMDKATGKALLIDGKEVTASKTFTPLEATGQEALIFDFNASALTEKKLVVFEELTQAGELVATHSDLNDANQTVEIPTKPAEPTALKTPEIKTNTTNAKENIQVKDVVDYKNLLPGKGYDGKEVTASKTNQLLPATGEVKSILLVIVGFLLLILSVLVLRYLRKNR